MDTMKTKHSRYKKHGYSAVKGKITVKSDKEG